MCLGDKVADAPSISPCIQWLVLNLTFGDDGEINQQYLHGQSLSGARGGAKPP